MYKLQSSIGGETSNDSNAYAITSDYCGGIWVLGFYTMHPTPSSKSGGRSQIASDQILTSDYDRGC